MKHPVSLTISDENLSFLNVFCKKHKFSKSWVVDRILQEYKKQMIAREFSLDAASDTNEDLDFVNADFTDFINILDDKESKTV